MRLFFLDQRRTRQLATFLLLSGTIVCIFPAPHPLMNYWASSVMFVSFGYLLLGLIFFFINRVRLMFVCMGCCAAICFFHLEIKPIYERALMNTVEEKPALDSLKMNSPFKNEYKTED